MQHSQVQTGCFYHRSAKGLRFWEGRVLKDIEAVHRDERACQVPPLSGGGVFHFIQDQVQILDHVPVAVSIMQTPGVQEVIGRLPHGLKRNNIQ